MYLLIYFSIALLIPFSLSSNVKKNINFLGYQWNIPIITAIVIIILVRAYAYNTGADYMVYYENYLYNGNTHWGENREIGFKHLNSTLHLFSDSPQFFFGFAAFVYMYAILMVSQLFGKADKWIVFFWSVILFVSSYNLYRQYFSLSFILLGYYWFVKKKYIITFLFIILAVMFHTSAIVGIALIIGIYWIRNRKVHRNYLLIAVMLTTILSTTILSSFLEQLSFISNFYLQATEKSYTTEGMLETMYETSILTYPLMIAYMVFIWYGDKLIKEEPNYRFLFYLFSFALIINPLTNQEILMRIRLYLDAFVPVFLGILAYRYKRVSRYPILWISLLFVIARFIHLLNNNGIAFPLIFKY